MADQDDADAANIASLSRSPKASPSFGPTFATVNQPSPSFNPPTSVHSASRSPSTTRPNGASAKTSSAQSLPMTASAASPSQAHPQQSGDAPDVNGAFPYGTRSRNRTGNPRPNYAEDMDMEYDLASKKKGQNANLPSSLPAGELSSGSNTRRSSNAAAPATSTSSTRPTPPAVIKDELPGMSSFPINQAPANSTRPTHISRKRKAPGTSPSNPPGNSPAAAAGSSRRTTSALSNTQARMSNTLTFEKCGGMLRNGKLRADDGTILSVDDQVYLICEPPGEPYYLARIMEFLHTGNDRTQAVDSLRVNWYFRPRDIQRKVNDTRVVFASMQSDTCPITSLRGKCRVLHRSEIDNLDEYRKAKDSFWFEKMFDRYIHRYYEVIPVQQVINVPVKVKRVLDERWRFVIVEIGRGKDLTSAIKSCKRCAGYCASNDSVDCAVCKNTYHMNCVRPPLLKKPARGFGWSCARCSRKQERKLEARNITGGDKSLDGEEEELIEEEEEDRSGPTDDMDIEKDDLQSERPHPPTAEQLAQSRMWPYRYLGIHCRVEDALDYDDRIYPRASSRLGPKHQANVPAWFGHPVEMVKTAEIRKRYLKAAGNKKDGKTAKDTPAATDAEKGGKEKRPKWVMDAPQGYIARGEDHPFGSSSTTAHRSFRMPDPGELSADRASGGHSKSVIMDEREALVQSYMEEAKALAQPNFNLREFSTNFLDKALELLTSNDYNVEKALEQLSRQNRRYDLKEPELTMKDILNFEEGVAKYGSELRNVSRHVGKTQKHGEIVRFYYMWKKTERGQQIWDNYEGRKGKKQIRQADARLADDVADDDDDSAFDSAKASQRKRGFECKFCTSRQSAQWRRAPATAPGTTVPIDSASKGSKDKSASLVVALCHRCAGLWRRYGIQWENIDEVAKKVAQGGGRALKRRIDEELLVELVKANQDNKIGLSSTTVQAAATVGLEIQADEAVGQDGPKKKVKTSTLEPVTTEASQSEPTHEASKKKTPDRPPEPQLVPEQPVLRQFPCKICFSGLKDDSTLIMCSHCRLTVHPDCYGVTNDRKPNWLCDTCDNDRRPECSTIYECLLCPHYHNEDEAAFETAKQNHKRKTEREKEKERLEKELLSNANSLYKKTKEENGMPTAPRQALKSTVGRNWSHVICSILNPSIKYGDAVKLKPAEGFTEAQQFLDATKDVRCKLCKSSKGALVHCDHCDAPVHATCAQLGGYHIGVSLTSRPKSSAIRSVTIGDVTGIPDVKVTCREHNDKAIFPLFAPSSLDGEQMSAIRAYAIVRKSTASGSLTGTARRADMIQSAAKQAAALQITETTNSKAKMSNGDGPASSTRGTRASLSNQHVQADQADAEDTHPRLTNGTHEVHAQPVQKCKICETEYSPKWHLVDDAYEASRVHDTATSAPKPMANGTSTGDLQTNGVADKSKVKEPSEKHADLTTMLCHRCFLRRSKAPPTPPRQPTPATEKHAEPQPDAGARGVQLNDRPPSPIHPSTHWQPAPAPPVLSQPSSEQQHKWHAPSEPSRSPYLGSERLPNGAAHSSPAPTPHPNPLYMPASHAPLPPHAYHAHRPAFVPPPPFHRDPVSYRPNQPTTHYPSNAYPTEGQSYKWERDPITGQSKRVPWPPPNRNAAPPPSTVSHHTPSAPPQSPSVHGQHLRSTSTHVRSPSFPESGPHGPPEADSNPFAVPTSRYSHASPPPAAYSSTHIYGSPRVRSRPQTPAASQDQEPKRVNDPPVPNGASASPSVKNLLH